MILVWKACVCFGRLKEKIMGLFNRKKKEKEVIEDTAKAEEESPYQAQPQAFQDDEGNTFIVFTLTEGTDTLLPADPENMYGIGGRKISDFRLGFCSLAEDSILDTLPYYACIRVLAPYVEEICAPFVRIRQLSNDELKEIIRMVHDDLDNRDIMQDAFRRNLEFLSEREMSAETVHKTFSSEDTHLYVFENVKFPSGNVIIADPLAVLPDQENTAYLDETLAPGEYPLILAAAEMPHDGKRIAAMKLQVTEHEAVSYQPAETWSMKNGIRYEDLPGFAVEAGLACITDEKAAEAYWRFLDEWEENHAGENIYNNYFAELFAQSYEEHPEVQREGGDFIRWTIPDSEEEMIMFASGYGDGFYNTYCGYDSDGKLSEIVSIFIDPELYLQK